MVCRVWAGAVDAGNQHYRAADVMNTEQVINFTIRYRKDVKPGMWVKFQDEKWIISTLGEYSLQENLSRSESVHCEGSERMMRQVQEALKNIGIPVIAGIWRATSPKSESAGAVRRVFQHHHGDGLSGRPARWRYRTYVYLNLWSDIDPTEMANRIRAGHVRRGFLDAGRKRQGI